MNGELGSIASIHHDYFHGNKKKKKGEKGFVTRKKDLPLTFASFVTYHKFLHLSMALFLHPKKWSLKSKQVSGGKVHTTLYCHFASMFLI